MKRISIMVLCATAIAGCGGGDSPSPGQIAAASITSSASGDSSVATLSQNDRPREYEGRIDVLFRGDADYSDALEFLEKTVGQHLKATPSPQPSPGGEGAIERGVPDLTSEQLTQAHQYMKDRGMKSAYDWNGYYKVIVADEDVATQIAAELSAHGKLIESAQLKYRPIPLGVAQPTPDLTAGQGYIGPLATTGGLNIQALWEKGLNGEFLGVSGTTLIDHNADTSHEDFLGQNVQVLDTSLYPATSGEIQHGTATSGILVAKKDNKGVTGIVHGVKVLSTAPISLSLQASSLAAFNAGTTSEVPGVREGDVITIVLGSETPDPVKYPGLPYEWTTITFKAMQQMTEMGVTFVEAAGNEQVDYDDSKYDSITKVDSGAIFVGASEAGNLVKADFSNCGSRVDVFAWGEGVLTTGYGDYGREPLLIADKDYINGSLLNVCFPHSWWLDEGGFVSNDLGQQVVQALCAKTAKYCKAGVVISLAPYKGGFCPKTHSLVPKVLDGKTIQTADDGGQFFYDTNPVTPEWNVSGQNQWYTNFSGTSASAPIIGGGVALLQEHVRKEWNADGTYKRAYLTSRQVREILKESGKGNVAKDTTDPTKPAACPIGVQPDFGKALKLIDDGWCPDKASNKCAVPQVKCFPIKTPEPPPIPPAPTAYTPQLSVAFDLDKDGRSDLIAFSRDRKWYVDLSSIGPNADHYGAWDLTLTPPAATLPTEGMLFPVVADYNSDGQADLAIYDSVGGKWFIKYTTADVLIGNWGNAWDRVIDYSTVAGWKAYSRPVPGDYDGDQWTDTGLVTPDGHWLIDYGAWILTPLTPNTPIKGKGFKQPCDENNPKAPVDMTWLGWEGGTGGGGGQPVSDTLGSFDKDVAFLTPQQLQEAPGWAYAPVVASYNGWDKINIYYVTPDGLPNAGQVDTSIGPDFGFGPDSPLDFKCGGIGEFIAPTDIDVTWTKWGKDFLIVPTFRDPVTGQWSIKWIEIHGWISDKINFGGVECRSIPGDYDGGGTLDRATLCDNGEFRIAYSSEKFPVSSDGLRHVVLPAIKDPLPAFVYPGGVSFQEIKAIFKTVDYLCPTVAPNGKTPPCTLWTLAPPPINPYFPQCVAAVKNQYKIDPCANPFKKVACEEMRIQQSQCVWDY